MDIKAKIEEVFRKLDTNEKLTSEEQEIIDLVIPRQTNKVENNNLENGNNKSMVKGSTWYKGNNDNGMANVLIISGITGIVSVISLLFLFAKI